MCVLGVSDGVQCAVRDGTYDAADVPDVRIEGMVTTWMVCSARCVAERTQHDAGAVYSQGSVGRT